MHNIPLPELLQRLNSTLSGLTAAEAEKRLHEHGPNELKEKKRVPVWLLWLNQFKDFMILILIAAAIISGLVGDLTDSIIILVIVLLNALLGFIQEFRAEKALDALRKMSITQARVIRDGTVSNISSTMLVPGDVVFLEAGNVVAADLRLAEAHNLRIDESSLTGESMPVDKLAGEMPGKEIPLAERYNMAFKGSLVTHGRAMGIVVATGMHTEFGKIAGLLQTESALTPLQVRMAEFGRKLSYIILLICVVLFLSGVLRGENPYTILLLSVSLAVAAIPEALPALITIALSRGASRLARKQALIRKLPAVETLGSVSFICADKTGTLTQNKMRVVETSNTSTDPEWLLTCMALNHDVSIDAANGLTGEATETALVHHTLQFFGSGKLKHLSETFPRLAELPFDSDRKCMTTVHKFDKQFLIVSKGAGEAISATLSSSEQKEIIEQFTNVQAADGRRILAYAFRFVDEIPDPFSYETVEKELELAGLVSLIDPPRENVREAIAECRSAGIKPIMITGDHPATATAIAREVGILTENDVMLTGLELMSNRSSVFPEQVEKIAVYARVTPDQKLNIVRALQNKGHFVAMTGDGVNDAPALKAANIGVAMGINGTDVSKEASDLVLLDDHFSTIVNAVKEGRRIYDNIRKFVKYIMTCNGAEIWTIFLAPLLGMPIPLLPIHILWINLVTDGLPALALANEKAEADVMDRPPRPPSESLFAGGVGYHILWVGILMAGVTLATQAWSLHHENANWQTMVFTVLALSQLGHVLAVRSDFTFLYKQSIRSNLPLMYSVLFTFLLQLSVIYLPFFNTWFNTSPLSLSELAFCIGMSLIVFHAVELEKWIKKRLGGG